LSRRFLRLAKKNRSFLAVVAIYCLIAGSTLEWHSLWLDEIYTIQAIQLDWREMISQRARAGHPPLFFAAQKLVVSAFGDSAFALRSMPFVFSLVSVILLYVLLRREYSILLSTAGASIFAFSPAQLMVAQMGRSYSMLQCLTLCHLIIVMSDQRVRWSIKNPCKSKVWRVGAIRVKLATQTEAADADASGLIFHPP
jgi:uncharacterized membrane protein